MLRVVSNLARILHTQCAMQCLRVRAVSYFVGCSSHVLEFVPFPFAFQFTSRVLVAVSHLLPTSQAALVYLWRLWD
jgi:hypothetical protein